MELVEFTKLYKEFTSLQPTSSVVVSDCFAVEVSNCPTAAAQPTVVDRVETCFLGEYAEVTKTNLPISEDGDPGSKLGTEDLSSNVGYCTSLHRTESVKQQRGSLFRGEKAVEPCVDGMSSVGHDEPFNKGSSDSGGGSGGNSSQGSGSGKKQKSGSESSNSSRQSHSGSRSGQKAGNGRSHSGSSDSSGDDGDDDKRRRPHHGGGGGSSKEPRQKLLDEDDEATDSADEGVDDATPNSMIMDFSSPPQSNKSESGTDPSTDPGTRTSQYPVNSPSYSHPGVTTERPTSLAPNINHFEGTTVSSDPLTSQDNEGLSGMVSIESMAPAESNTVETSNAINMIVGYGVPVSAPPQQASDKSLPESEIGTLTLDSPPPLGEEKPTPMATPVPITPVLSPALTLLPQVCFVFYLLCLCWCV